MPLIRTSPRMLPRDYWVTDAKATYAAEDADKILGTYYITTNQPGGGAHICNCGYVAAPQARGQGLAAQICEHSQTEASALGYKAMQFNFVLASNTGAVKLWHRLGFETIGTIPDAFVHPQQGMVDAHVMYKRLNWTQRNAKRSCLLPVPCRLARPIRTVSPQ